MWWLPASIQKILRQRRHVELAAPLLAKHRCTNGKPAPYSLCSSPIQGQQFLLHLIILALTAIRRMLRQEEGSRGRCSE